MNTMKRRSFPSLVSIVSAVVFLFIIVGMRLSHAADEMEVTLYQDGIHASTLLSDGRLEIRVGGPDDFLAEETGDGEVTWYLPANAPAGAYHYEVFLSVQAVQQGGDNQSDSISAREHGRFEVLNGAIVLSSENGERTGAVEPAANFLAGVLKGLMDLILPSAHAADLSASGTYGGVIELDATIYGPDREWEILGTSSRFSIFDDVDDTNHNYKRVFDIYHSLNNERSFLVDTNGDISLADGSVFVDRSANRLGIGTTTPEYPLHVRSSASSAQLIRLDVGATNGDWSLFPGSDGLYLQNVASYPVKFQNLAPTNSLVVTPSGNIGVGTDVASEAMDVYRAGSAARFKLTSVTDTATSQAPQIIQQRARSGPAALQSGDAIGSFSFRGHTGSGYSGSKAYIAALATENWNASANGTDLHFAVTPNGSTSVRTVMIITNDGRVRINGTTLNVPDYVFEKEYDLMPLDELQSYIEKEKRLPHVAGAAKVHDEGLDLGGTQMVLLRKVEELTLYTLQQHKQLQEQQDRIAALQQTNEGLREQFEKRLLTLEDRVQKE